MSTKQAILRDGATIHLAGIPFRLVGGATVESHENNVEMVRNTMPSSFESDDFPAFVRNPDLLRPSLLRTIRRWFGR